MVASDLWIETYTGKRVNPLHIRGEQIDIRDIAHSLAMQCRFGGHCKQFYSVAEHSIFVARIVATSTRNADPMTIKAALLHNAAEAYIIDIPRPIKHHPQLKYLVEAEKQILGKIMTRFECVGADWELVKDADEAALATEAWCLMISKGEGWNLSQKPVPISMTTYQSPYESEMAFIHNFNDLTESIGSSS